MIENLQNFTKRVNMDVTQLIKEMLNRLTGRQVFKEDNPKFVQWQQGEPP